jgi:hypothetical protein
LDKCLLVSKYGGKWSISVFGLIERLKM